jgi:hypothetical protein
MNPFPQITVPLISAPVGGPLEWFADYGAVPTWLLLAVGAAFVAVLLSLLHGKWQLHNGPLLRHVWAPTVCAQSLERDARASRATPF